MASGLPTNFRFMSKNQRRKAQRRLRNAVRSFRAHHETVNHERTYYLAEYLKARKELATVRRWAEALQKECASLRSVHTTPSGLYIVRGTP